MDSGERERERVGGRASGRGLIAISASLLKKRREKGMKRRGEELSVRSASREYLWLLYPGTIEERITRNGVAWPGITSLPTLFSICSSFYSGFSTVRKTVHWYHPYNQPIHPAVCPFRVSLTLIVLKERKRRKKKGNKKENVYINDQRLKKEWEKRKLLE